MFDQKVAAHENILQEIERGNYKHIQAISIDVTNAGWAPGATGGQNGEYEIDGNALIMLPSYMRASDATVTAACSTVAKIYIFPNTKKAPGIPFSAIGAAAFGDFGGLCCSFKRFFVYVQTTDAGKQIHLGILKGMNLYGVGTKYTQIIGSYEG